MRSGSVVLLLAHGAREEWGRRIQPKQFAAPNMSILHPTSITEIALQRERIKLREIPAWIARPRACIAILLLADLAALSVGAAVSVLVWRHFGINFSTEFYARLWPVLLVFPVA